VRQPPGVCSGGVVAAPEKRQWLRAQHRSRLALSRPKWCPCELDTSDNGEASRVSLSVAAIDIGQLGASFAIKVAA